MLSITRRILGRFSSVEGATKVNLPELKFGYSALEPVISSKLLETHHKKHHQTYVNNLNAALDQF
jgi:superoxide dismutase